MHKYTNSHSNLKNVILILNLYAQNNVASKYIKKWSKLQEKNGQAHH